MFFSIIDKKLYRRCNLAIIESAWQISSRAQMKGCSYVTCKYVLDCFCLKHPGTIWTIWFVQLSENIADTTESPGVVAPPSTGWWHFLTQAPVTGETFCPRDAFRGRTPPHLREFVADRKTDCSASLFVLAGKHTQIHLHTLTQTNTRTLGRTPQTLRPKTNPRLWSLQAVPLLSPSWHPVQDPIFLLWPVFKLGFVVQCFERLFVKHDKQDMAGLLKEKKSFLVNSLSANDKVHVQTGRAN